MTNDMQQELIHLIAPMNLLPRAKAMMEQHGYLVEDGRVTLPVLRGGYPQTRNDRKEQKTMLIIQNKIEDEGKILERDPRLGARVICRSLLPSFVLLGTIQRIVQHTNGMESWKVLTDGPMIEEGPSDGFLLYEGPEFRAGERVQYHLDEGGYWLAMVVEPEWACDHLRFLILVDSDEHAAVKVEHGYTFAADPARLSAI